MSALTGARAYADLLGYLGDLEFVDALVVTRVEGDKLWLSLVTPADPEQLLALFRLDRRLFPNSLSATPGVALDLVWQRR
ncbi:MAG: hypothetical protein ACN6I7_00155 [bacterium]